ncbi:MAG: nitronate monooxygenase [Phenylobacterium sp.]|nr:nitronate monooxygenase [Phenylobacterium sp.]
MFIASSRDLVVAQCKAGVVGSFPALNARPQAELTDWIVEIRERLAAAEAEDAAGPVAPFAVNQVMSPLNDRWQADLATIVREQVPLIITSLRAPPAEIIQEVHGYQGLVFHDVTNLRHARKAAQAGVDGLILVAAGAGGQGGDRSPFALVNQVREFFDGTILLSGAMSTGSDVLAAQAMGADMAYLGTRFLAAAESATSPEHKTEILQSDADDIIYTNIFTGIYGNYLKVTLANAGLDVNNLPAYSEATAKYKRGADGEVKVWRDIRGAGHGCGSIKDVETVGEIVDRLEAEYRAALAGLNTRAFA